MSEFIHVAAKFGGTSMAQPEVVAGIVEARDDHRVIVVSAPGVDADHPEKMTDQLASVADCVLDGDERTFLQTRDEVIDRFDHLYNNLGSNDRSQLKDIATDLFCAVQDSDDVRTHAMSIGEELSAHYFSRFIGVRYLPAEWVRFGRNAELKRAESAAMLGQSLIRLGSGEKIVTPGFFGFDRLGRRHLLGRGGSDRTGALAALGLAGMFGDGNVVYENWTDQDGIRSGDPRFVDETLLIDELTRREVREGAHGGSGILQGDVIVDLNGSTLPMIVRNTLNTGSSGTRILTKRDVDPDQPVVSVSARELMTVSIEDMGMAGADAYLRRVMTDAASQGLSIEHMPASQDALMVTLHEDAPFGSIQAFAESLKNNALSTHAVVEITEKAVVYLVGEALTDPLIKARVLGHSALNLADMGIGVDADVSHPNSPSLAFLIDRADLDQGRQGLHDYFISSRA